MSEDPRLQRAWEDNARLTSALRFIDFHYPSSFMKDGSLPEFCRKVIAEQARFKKTYCSQCGCEFGPGNSGYSHCDDHRHEGVTTPAEDEALEQWKRRAADAAKFIQMIFKLDAKNKEQAERIAIEKRCLKEAWAENVRLGKLLDDERTKNKRLHERQDGIRGRW